MIRLAQTLAAWGRPDFRQVFKAEAEALDASELPFQAGLTQSSHALTDRWEVLLLQATDTPDGLRIRAGLFYAGIIAGCSCADDPSPVDPIPEYCEVEFVIRRSDGVARVMLAQD